MNRRQLFALSAGAAVAAALPAKAAIGGVNVVRLASIHETVYGYTPGPPLVEDLLKDPVRWCRMVGARSLRVTGDPEQTDLLNACWKAFYQGGFGEMQVEPNATEPAGVYTFTLPEPHEVGQAVVGQAVVGQGVSYGRIEHTKAYDLEHAVWAGNLYDADGPTRHFRG